MIILPDPPAAESLTPDTFLKEARGKEKAAR
jgi:hypothetical protein